MNFFINTINMQKLFYGFYVRKLHPGYALWAIKRNNTGSLRIVSKNQFK